MHLICSICLRQLLDFCVYIGRAWLSPGRVGARDIAHLSTCVTNSWDPHGGCKRETRWDSSQTVTGLSCRYNSKTKGGRHAVVWLGTKNEVIAKNLAISCNCSDCSSPSSIKITVRGAKGPLPFCYPKTYSAVRYPWQQNESELARRYSHLPAPTNLAIWH